MGGILRKLRIALDFDDLIAGTSIVKANWINKNVPNWRELLAKFKADDFMASWGISVEESSKKSEDYANALASIPPWLTDRVNCIQVIGRENYEKMSYEIYGPSTMDAPEIEGVKESLNEMSKKWHELIIVTSRRKEHLKFVEQWLEEKGMAGWINEIYSIREADNKVPFCIENEINVLIDDEIRFLRGKAPKLLKLLVPSGAREINENTKVHIIENDQPKIVPILEIAKAENIKIIPKFKPYVENEIKNYFT